MTAAAETEFDVRHFPFDTQHLQAVFEVLGFSRNEVMLRIDPNMAAVFASNVHLPQWTINRVNTWIVDDSKPGPSSSTLIVGVDVERKSWYVRRLIIVPLILIVLLSFSVFWMDRSSLGDRVSISFIGILTVVTYQFATAAYLPSISYATLIHGFLSVSFMVMCATVVINLVVGSLDKRGNHKLGDLVDRQCRWLFPLGYFGMILSLLLGTEFLL